jgi:RNA polymerase sigma factor (TIGR02999 family)
MWFLRAGPVRINQQLSLTRSARPLSDVTRLLDAAAAGDSGTAEKLLPLVYKELRALAASKLAHEAPQTLSGTALVHEAYLRLVGNNTERPWNNRGHFFGAAAEAMRRILVEAARRRDSQKRGGAWDRVSLEHLPAASLGNGADDLIALDQALSELERHDSPAAALVKLRYFAGLSHQEAADSLGVSRRAADRLWALARAWLYRRLSDG